MLQPVELRIAPFLARLRTGAGRRTLSLGLALLIEALLLLLLLSLGTEKGPGRKEDGATVVTLQAAETAGEPADPASAAPAPQEAERPEPEPAPTEPAPAPSAEPLPPPPPLLPAPPLPAARAPAADPIKQVVPARRRAYGPPDTGGPPALRDSERVGTAPNGEPLYAAAWYREPRPDQLHPYLSTARGPGWGLIACRTAPDFRVEDCVGLDEYPQGSQITRAILAAAWEFKVRPPRLGGRPQIGSWVRIRIDYGLERR